MRCLAWFKKFLVATGSVNFGWLTQPMAIRKNPILNHTGFTL